MADETETDQVTADDEIRMRLRSINVQLLRLLEEVAAGRDDAVAKIVTALERNNAGPGPAPAGAPAPTAPRTGPRWFLAGLAIGAAGMLVLMRYIGG